MKPKLNNVNSKKYKCLSITTLLTIIIIKRGVVRKEGNTNLFTTKYESITGIKLVVL